MATKCLFLSIHERKFNCSVKVIHLFAKYKQIELHIEVFLYLSSTIIVNYILCMYMHINP